MANYQLLDPREHADTKILEVASLFQLDRGLLCAAFASEFRALATDFPIVFIKDQTTGHFLSAVLLGLSSENLSCLDTSGRWGDAYQPWSLQRQPFLIANKEERDGGTTPLVSIDVDHPMVNDQQGLRIFQDNDSLSAVAETKITALRSIHASAQATDAFVQSVIELELITGLKIQGRTDRGEEIAISGIYGVDEEALANLNRDTLFELHQKGHLELLYLMVTSLNKISSFMRQLNRS